MAILRKFYFGVRAKSDLDLKVDYLTQMRTQAPLYGYSMQQPVNGEKRKHGAIQIQTCLSDIVVSVA